VGYVSRFGIEPSTQTGIFSVHISSSSLGSGSSTPKYTKGTPE